MIARSSPVVVLVAFVMLLADSLGVNTLLPSSAAAQDAASSPWFEEIAEQRGIRFVHRSGAQGKYNLPEITGGGAALFDMDNDGDLDAYLVQAGNLADPASLVSGDRLLRNRGDGTFDDVTAQSGITDRGYGMGVTAGDYDNDGDIDLYVTNLGPNVLLQNDGRGRFADVTAHAGVGDPSWSTSTAFLDYDADGDLDLSVANYINWSPSVEFPCYVPSGARDYCSPRSYNAPSSDTLYRNNGDGRFADVSAEAGLRAADGNGLGVVAGYFDGDALIDMYVANDRTPNQLWLNLGKGKFRDEALARGSAVDIDGKAKAGMGVHAADLDDDGDSDLLVVNLDGESDSFYRNEGSFFSDDTTSAGLRTASRSFTRFGMGLVDFDNDGWLDLYEANGRVGRRAGAAPAGDPYAEPNLLFRGAAGPRFQELQPRGGTARLLTATSRAAAFGDIDNDGGVDVLVINRDAPAHLLHNIVGGRGRWIAFRVLEQHGRDALGATVTATVGGRKLVRDVRAAYSYMASNDPRVHLGLGKETAVKNVSVRWADGKVQQFGDFKADQGATLRRKR